MRQAHLWPAVGPLGWGEVWHARSFMRAGPGCQRRGRANRLLSGHTIGVRTCISFFFTLYAILRLACLPACLSHLLHLQDLVGLRVVLQATGEEIGHVSDVFDGTGTHDVLRIQLTPAKLEQLAAAAASSSSSGAEDEEEEEAEAAGGGGASGQRHVLLPFAKALVPVVDLAGGRMEVTPPEGLLELAAPSNMRRPRRENRGKRERRRTRPKGQGGATAGSTDAAAASPQPLHSDAE